MPRRVPFTRAADLDTVERLLEQGDRAVTVIFDADNTLVPQGVSIDTFRTEVSSAIARFERLDRVERVVVLTNGPERGVPTMIHRGNKPWTTRRRLGITQDRHVWVIGDQILTDGVLAWRLGASFVHVAIDVTNEAQRQAIMRKLGALVQRALFIDTAAPDGR